MHCEFTPASHGLRQRTRMAGANGGKLALLPCMLAGPLAGKTQRSQQRLPAPVVFFSSDPGILAAPIKDGAGDAAEGMLTAASQIFRRPQHGTLSHSGIRSEPRFKLQSLRPRPRFAAAARSVTLRAAAVATVPPVRSLPNRSLCARCPLRDSEPESTERAQAFNARTVLASLPQMPGAVCGNSAWVFLACLNARQRV